MGKKTEFSRLSDGVVEQLIREIDESGSVSPLMQLVAKNMLEMLHILWNQLEERDRLIGELEGKIRVLENEFRVLIHELTTLGYIHLGERRQVLKRSLLNQEALIALLKRKNIIRKEELVAEIKKLSR
ncbi:MAG: hypothetical protein ACWGN7_07000 [Thermodesulfovibrionales bacterium]